MKKWEVELDRFFNSYVHSKESTSPADLIEEIFTVEKLYEGYEISSTDCNGDEYWSTHWDAHYSEKYDAVIHLQHRTLQPPQHNISVIHSSARTPNTCLVTYTSTGYDRKILIDNNSEIAPLEVYVKSILFYLLWEGSIVKKRKSLSRIPIIGETVSKLYFSEWTGSTVNLQMDELYWKSRKLKKALEHWIDALPEASYK
jgi:hypothetical protein